MVRAFRPEDAAAVLPLLRELLPLRVETEATLAVAAATTRCWLAEANGDAVGFARVDGHELWLGVAERARGHGVGSELWARVEEHADEPAVCWTDGDDGIRFAVRRGFAPSGRTIVLVLDVAASVPDEVTAPAGVELVAWSELRSVPADLEAAEHAASPALRPEGSFAALVDGRPVSYALLVADERGHGESQYAFTLPAFRRRGLATLCKRALVGWARTNGIHRIAAANDEANDAILALNTRLGFRPHHVQTTLTRR